MKIWIVAKTRMKKMRCVGGVGEDGRSWRIMGPDGSHHREDTPFEVGQCWEMELRPVDGCRPPHVEDARLLSYELVGDGVPLARQLPSGVTVWSGGPQTLFDGHLRFTDTGRAYVGRESVPTCSTGFWRLDAPLRLRGDAVRYGYQCGRHRFAIKYVGVAEPVQELPAGTLVRVSLARWWSGEHGVEERCYLQLSGWFLEQDDDAKPAAPVPPQPAVESAPANTQAPVPGFAVPDSVELDGQKILTWITNDPKPERFEALIGCQIDDGTVSDLQTVTGSDGSALLIDGKALPFAHVTKILQNATVSVPTGGAAGQPSALLVAMDLTDPAWLAAREILLSRGLEPDHIGDRALGFKLADALTNDDLLPDESDRIAIYQRLKGLEKWEVGLRLCRRWREKLEAKSGGVDLGTCLMEGTLWRGKKRPDKALEVTDCVTRSGIEKVTDRGLRAMVWTLRAWCYADQSDKRAVRLASGRALGAGAAPGHLPSLFAH